MGLWVGVWVCGSIGVWVCGSVCGSICVCGSVCWFVDRYVFFSIDVCLWSGVRFCGLVCEIVDRCLHWFCKSVCFVDRCVGNVWVCGSVCVCVFMDRCVGLWIGVWVCGSVCSSVCGFVDRCVSLFIHFLEFMKIWIVKTYHLNSVYFMKDVIVCKLNF